MVHPDVQTSIPYLLSYQQRRIRRFELKVAEEYQKRKMRCPVHLSVGQEAAAAGVGLALARDDFAVSGHRAHAHYLAKGGDARRMIAEFYGKSSGCSRGKGGSMHLIDLAAGFKGSTAIVANTIPVGVGLGLSIKLAKTNQISCVFLGDGAIEAGAFYEAASFAALKKLPVLFVCENNLYSVYSPLEVRQPEGRVIHKLAAAIGLSSHHGDGNRVDEVYELVRGLVAKIRDGAGPQFVELATYRWLEHCGPFYDNDLGYRTVAEFEAWKKLDPILYYEDKVLREGHLTREVLTAIDQRIDQEITEAFAFAEAAPFPEAREAHDHIYAAQ